MADNSKIKLPVLIDKSKITKTKQGDQMALLKVADLSGRLEVAVFPKVYKSIKNRIKIVYTQQHLGALANRYIWIRKYCN